MLESPAECGGLGNYAPTESLSSKLRSIVINLTDIEVESFSEERQRLKESRCVRDVNILLLKSVTRIVHAISTYVLRQLIHEI